MQVHYISPFVQSSSNTVLFDCCSAYMYTFSIICTIVPDWQKNGGRKNFVNVVFCGKLLPMREMGE